jgi:hypothetical protein
MLLLGGGLYILIGPSLSGLALRHGTPLGWGVAKIMSPLVSRLGGLFFRECPKLSSVTLHITNHLFTYLPTERDWDIYPLYQSET